MNKPTPVQAPNIAYNIKSSPKGYFNKREITNIDPEAMIVGSKNVFINDGDKIETRKGYVIDGTQGAIKNGSYESFDFISKNGKKILRIYENAVANNATLDLRFVASDSTVSYIPLKENLLAGTAKFTSWWDNDEVTRTLLFVDNTNAIHQWGGGVATVASNTANTLTLEGTDTWAEKGFFILKSARAVTIPGYGTFTYTGGETTTTLTGLVGLPAIPVGTPVVQAVQSYSTLTGIPTGSMDKIDLIWTKNNHCIIGSTLSSVVWGSTTDDFTDFSFTTPLRASSEGFKITLDNFTVGFVDDENDDASFSIFAGVDELYPIKFVLSADQAGESFTITKLRTGNGQAAVSQSAIIPVKNGFMFMTNEKALSWLTNVQNIFTPQSLPISDPIKNDFDVFDMTNVSGVFWQNALWLAIPRENLVYVYDFDKALWQAPFTIPVARFSITEDNELIGHSSYENTSYMLNVGETDNGILPEFVASFAYDQYGKRANYKQFQRYYNEVYMPTKTTLTVQHLYEYGGATAVKEKTIVGTDLTYRFAPVVDVSLGKFSLGKNPLGSISGSSATIFKYRKIHLLPAIDFFEHQVIYRSSTPFQILAHGADVIESPAMPTHLTN
jgi:hypothetical protein